MVPPTYMSPEIAKFISLLESELGYAEKSSGYTKFGKWYNDVESDYDYSSQPWCDMYISWAAKKLGYEDWIGQFAWTPSHARWFEKQGAWGKTPEPGALVFYDWSGRDSIKGIDHVGVVTKVVGHRIHTIEGNIDGGVAKRKVRDQKKVVGYGYPDKVREQQLEEKELKDSTVEPASGKDQAAAPGELLRTLIPDAESDLLMLAPRPDGAPEREPAKEAAAPARAEARSRPEEPAKKTTGVVPKHVPKHAAKAAPKATAATGTGATTQQPGPASPAQEAGGNATTITEATGLPVSAMPQQPAILDLGSPTVLAPVLLAAVALIAHAKVKQARLRPAAALAVAGAGVAKPGAATKRTAGKRRAGHRRTRRPATAVVLTAPLPDATATWATAAHPGAGRHVTTQHVTAQALTEALAAQAVTTSPVATPSVLTPAVVATPGASTTTPPVLTPLDRSALDVPARTGPGSYLGRRRRECPVEETGTFIPEPSPRGRRHRSATTTFQRSWDGAAEHGSDTWNPAEVGANWPIPEATTPWNAFAPAPRPDPALRGRRHRMTRIDTRIDTRADTRGDLLDLTHAVPGSPEGAAARGRHSRV